MFEGTYGCPCKRALGAHWLLTNTRTGNTNFLFCEGKSLLLSVSDNKHKSEQLQWVNRLFFGMAAANRSGRSRQLTPSWRQSNRKSCCFHLARFSLCTNWNQGKRVIRSANTLENPTSWCFLYEGPLSQYHWLMQLNQRFLHIFCLSSSKAHYGPHKLNILKTWPFANVIE